MVPGARGECLREALGAWLLFGWLAVSGWGQGSGATRARGTESGLLTSGARPLVLTITMARTEANFSL